MPAPLALDLQLVRGRFSDRLEQLLDSEGFQKESLCTRCQCLLLYVEVGASEEYRGTRAHLEDLLCGAHAILDGHPLVPDNDHGFLAHLRSEERRVGKECRSRWS